MQNLDGFIALFENFQGLHRIGRDRSVAAIHPERLRKLKGCAVHIAQTRRKQSQARPRRRRAGIGSDFLLGLGLRGAISFRSLFRARKVAVGVAQIAI